MYRRFGSGCASGPAQIAAVIAARLIACPPNGAAIKVEIPVPTSSGGDGGSKPLARSTAKPGMFYDAMVTRNSGSAIETIAGQEKTGMTHSSCGHCQPLVKGATPAEALPGKAPNAASAYISAAMTTAAGAA